MGAGLPGKTWPALVRAGLEKNVIKRYLVAVIAALGLFLGACTDTDDTTVDDTTVDTLTDDTTTDTFTDDTLTDDTLTDDTLTDDTTATTLG